MLAHRDTACSQQAVRLKVFSRDEEIFTPAYPRVFYNGILLSYLMIHVVFAILYLSNIGTLIFGKGHPTLSELTTHFVVVLFPRTLGRTQI